MRIFEKRGEHQSGHDTGRSGAELSGAERTDKKNSGEYSKRADGVRERRKRHIETREGKETRRVETGRETSAKIETKEPDSTCLVRLKVNNHFLQQEWLRQC